MGRLGCPASNVIVFINGIILHSRNHIDNKQHLEKLLIGLRNAGLKSQSFKM
jgi:hypothetical protein